ncbi:hypothetical protein Y032_0005g2463 [Ancylostoma ceylanicum]|uniref:Uncharacterized protein n=1 Tax=Ancylostoma ceylanicum TaxID=53326 RepID=A0A016VS49_9BILA|nr:hypothetical protein Y032_0005g2463 [Ancylostoma ceylanicum]
MWPSLFCSFEQNRHGCLEPVRSIKEAQLASITKSFCETLAIDSPCCETSAANFSILSSTSSAPSPLSSRIDDSGEGAADFVVDGEVEIVEGHG